MPVGKDRLYLQQVGNVFHYYHNFYYCDYCLFLLSSILSQWAYGAKTMSYRRRCDVLTLHRRKYDVILSHVRVGSPSLWEMAQHNSKYSPRGPLNPQSIKCAYLAWHQAMYLYIAFMGRYITSTLLTSRHFITCP